MKHFRSIGFLIATVLMLVMTFTSCRPPIAGPPPIPEGAKPGYVTVKDGLDFSVLMADNKNKTFNLDSKNGEAELAPGQYRILRANIIKTDGEGRKWSLAGSGVNSIIEIKEGQKVALPFGEPIVIRVQKGSSSYNIEILGYDGERYDYVSVNGKVQSAPSFRIIDSQGKEIGAGHFEYG